MKGIGKNKTYCDNLTATACVAASDVALVTLYLALLSLLAPAFAKLSPLITFYDIVIVMICLCNVCVCVFVNTNNLFFFSN